MYCRLKKSKLFLHYFNLYCILYIVIGVYICGCILGGVGEIWPLLIFIITCINKKPGERITSRPFLMRHEQLSRRKAIYEELHPETRQGMRNGQTSKNETISLLETPSFTEDTSTKLGVSRRTVEQNRNEIPSQRNAQK